MGSAVDQRSAAPVLLLLCSDFRTTRSVDLVVIEKTVDALAAMHGYVADGEPVNFDTIRVPGPQVGLSDSSSDEFGVLAHYTHLLLGLHGGELIILSYHIGLGHEPGCGREGRSHSDVSVMRRHAVEAVAALRARFPLHTFEVIEIAVAGGRTVSATPIEINQESAAIQMEPALDGALATP